MSDESQENVRKMRELLAKSQTPKGNAEQVRHVTADRGGIAVHADGPVHIGISPVAQRKPFFTFNLLLRLYFLPIFLVYVGARLVPLWRSRPEGQPPFLGLQYIGSQVSLWELPVIGITTAVIAAGLAALTRWLLRS
ncbi:hypothetical protein [Xanthomonas campestris]|uniref:hypothetical protein n=1 Tax=Xanthomonas campestris TaxID=339 RepID=UPI000E32957D|nr:hypothetical protein [Xanthomonas campestris]RFF48047.1 hypothetical protein D0A35_16070 [Xanthomonas campestris]